MCQLSRLSASLILLPWYAGTCFHEPRRQHLSLPARGSPRFAAAVRIDNGAKVTSGDRAPRRLPPLTARSFLLSQLIPTLISGRAQSGATMFC